MISNVSQQSLLSDAIRVNFLAYPLVDVVACDVLYTSMNIHNDVERRFATTMCIHSTMEITTRGKLPCQAGSFALVCDCSSWAMNVGWGIRTGVHDVYSQRCRYKIDIAYNLRPLQSGCAAGAKILDYYKSPSAWLQAPISVTRLRRPIGRASRGPLRSLMKHIAFSVALVGENYRLGVDYGNQLRISAPGRL